MATVGTHPRLAAALEDARDAVREAVELIESAGGVAVDVDAPAETRRSLAEARTCVQTGELWVDRAGLIE